MSTTKKKTTTKKAASKIAKKTIKNATTKVAKKNTKKTTKTTATKSAPKKTSTKKATKKKIVHALVCAEGEECFWTTNGDVLENLAELRLAFGSMADEVFLHHVTSEKNDFADWVESVLGDAECANALRRASKPRAAETVVVRYLKKYHY